MMSAEDTINDENQDEEINEKIKKTLKFKVKKPKRLKNK